MKFVETSERVKMQENELMLQMATNDMKNPYSFFNGYFRRDKNHFVIYLVEQRKFIRQF